MSEASQATQASQGALIKGTLEVNFHKRSD